MYGRNYPEQRMKKVTAIKKRRRLYNKNTDAFVFCKGDSHYRKGAICSSFSESKEVSKGFSYICLNTDRTTFNFWGKDGIFRIDAGIDGMRVLLHSLPEGILYDARG